MALVRRPAQTASWPPAPSQVKREHTVQPKEGLLKIAQKENIDVWHLIEFNFKTRNPREVNWYLHNYLGCKQQTKDRKNYVFSGGEVIYIPYTSGDSCPVPVFSKHRHVGRGSDYDLIWDVAHSKVTVRVKLEWNFDSKISATDRGKFKSDFTAAVNSFWNKQTYYLEPQQGLDPAGTCDASRPVDCGVNDPTWAIPLDTYGYPKNIQIHFRLVSTTKGEHWDVEVSPKSERSNVHPISGNVNVGLNDSRWVLAHEFGHALGLPDEYDALRFGSDFCKNRRGGDFEWTCVENWSNDSAHFGDTQALMNIGPEVRARYFYFIRDDVNKWTNHRYMFQVRPIRRGDSTGGDALPPSP